MILNTKSTKYTAELVKVIVKAIKNGTEKDLPSSIYHAYDTGYIYIGIGDDILAYINNRYERVSGNKYLLVCSMGGALSIVEDYEVTTQI